jgi:hypothetical protein
VNIFFSDQWEFNDATLFQHHSLWQMFTWQHGPHRQGAGALLQRLIEPLFQWNSRTESFVVGGVITIAAICALWLKRKLYGEISYSDVIIPIVFFSTLQFETLFITANFAHGPLPLLFILLYCLAWTCRSLPARYSLVLIINFLTIYTGFGMLLGVLTPFFFAIDYWVNLRKTEKGLIYFVVALLLSLASFGSFFLNYKIQPAADCFSGQMQSPLDYAWYMALMFAPFFGATGTGAFTTMVGVIAVCALLVCLAFSVWRLLRTPETDAQGSRVQDEHTQASRWTKHFIIAILIAYCLLFSVGTAHGRLCLGIQYAQSSRYVIYLNLGLLGLYFTLLMIPNRIARNVLVAILGVSLLGTISSAERQRAIMTRIQNSKRAWKNCYLALNDLAECNRHARLHPDDPERIHMQEKLDFLKRTRQNLFLDSK